MPCANGLGEGPLWDHDLALLYWVDIAAQRIHWFDPDSGLKGHWQLPVRASALALRNDGTLLVATDRGFGTFNPRTSAFALQLHPEPEREGNRSNDGHADVKGRFWIGTMDDTERSSSGALYRLDPDWSVTRVLDHLGIPNTVLCTADGRALYVADSKSRELFRFTVGSSGSLHDPKLLARLAPDEGAPDGSALDEEGFLWNAQWGASRIVRYAPDGEVDRIVNVPVGQPTSCTFGGRDLSTLFITSARKGLSEQALAREPLAGGVFAFTPGVRGLVASRFGG